ncbi:MAG: ABC transporter substrate-binding protein [Candidatus Promineifilaceae bacterium]
MPTSCSPSRQRRPNLDQQPVGTGPFQFVDYQTDAVIRYKAFPDYWDGKVAIDDLIFAITADAGGAHAEAQGRRMRYHVLPEPGRHRRRCKANAEPRR